MHEIDNVELTKVISIQEHAFLPLSGRKTLPQLTYRKTRPPGLIARVSVDVGVGFARPLAMEHL